MTDRRPSLHDFPIPADVKPCGYWTHDMLEMAAHIGAHATLLIVDLYGGTDPYVAKDPSRSKFTELIGEDKAAILSRVYGGTNVHVPVGTRALLRARRAGILAAVRNHSMSLTQAARYRGMGSRNYISHLVNHTDDGEGAIPMLPRPATDPRQLVMFEEELA